MLQELRLDLKNSANGINQKKIIMLGLDQEPIQILLKVPLQMFNKIKSYNCNQAMIMIESQLVLDHLFNRTNTKELVMLIVKAGWIQTNRNNRNLLNNQKRGSHLCSSQLVLETGQYTQVKTQKLELLDSLNQSLSFVIRMALS